MWTIIPKDKYTERFLKSPVWKEKNVLLTYLICAFQELMHHANLLSLNVIIVYGWLFFCSFLIFLIFFFWGGGTIYVFGVVIAVKTMNRPWLSMVLPWLYMANSHGQPWFGNGQPWTVDETILTVFDHSNDTHWTMIDRGRPWSIIVWLMFVHGQPWS